MKPRPNMCAALVLLLALSSATRVAGSAGTALDGYAASVNGGIITVGDVMLSIQSDLMKLADRYSGSELNRERERLFTRGLNDLIAQKLILAEAARLQMQVPDKMVDDRINQTIYSRFDNDRAKFLAALTADRLTVDDWRKETRERIIVSLLTRQEVQEKIKLSPADLRDAYEKDREAYSEPARARISLIVIRAEKDADALSIQREDAIRIRGRILAGESFAELARERSQDSRAPAGGDWGWVEPKDLRPELKAAVESLAPGALSEVIETPESFYILRVEEKTEAREKSFEEVRSDVEAKLREKEFDRLYNRWIERLKRRYAVTTF